MFDSDQERENVEKLIAMQNEKQKFESQRLQSIDENQIVEEFMEGEASRQEQEDSNVRKGKPTGKFRCENCPRKFNTTTLLKQHFPSHRACPGFYCDKCSKAFYQSASLNTHKRYAH